jgi:ubiquinone/menaquinone biosynthesis C-methylase UbiE
LDPRQIEEHNRYQRWYYESTNKKTMRPTASPYVLRQVERMIAAAELGPGQRVLEVGCGMGRYTLPLLERGLDLTCLDLSPVLLRQLQEAVPNRKLSLLACDVADAHRHTDQRFDRAIGFFTLHHMHDLYAVFQGLCKVLAPGARVAFCEPVAYNPLYYTKNGRNYSGT